MVLISGGEEMNDEELRKGQNLFRSRSNWSGVWKNVWQRPFKKALEIAERINILMATHWYAQG
jgi:hypothetical protein